MSGSSRWRRQAGAAMVEMAIVLSIFIMLMLGIAEFSMAYFSWHRAAEGAREGLRYAIVSSPVTTLPDCSAATPVPSVKQCTDTDADCLPLVRHVQRIAPDVRGNQLRVTYTCSDAGNPDRPEALLIPEIELELTGLRYTFAVPGIIGLGSTMNLPVITVTRTGEDLYTPAGS